MRREITEPSPIVTLLNPKRASTDVDGGSLMRLLFTPRSLQQEHIVFACRSNTEGGSCALVASHVDETLASMSLRPQAEEHAQTREYQDWKRL